MTTPTPVEVTELKPCPFCGAQPGCKINQTAGYRVVTIACSCGAHGRSHTEPVGADAALAEAIAAWNTRHRTEALASAAGEPVAWMYSNADDLTPCVSSERWREPEAQDWTETPLYTAPPLASQRALVEASPALMDLAVAALIEARNALKQHWLDWDGEPEDGWALRLAWAKCDQTLSILEENSFDKMLAALTLTKAQEMEG